MSDDAEFSDAEKAAEARREAQLRRWVYPKRVALGEMAAADAERQTALMEAIAADYARLAEARRADLHPDLFAGAAMDVRRDDG